MSNPTIRKSIRKSLGALVLGLATAGATPMVSAQVLYEMIPNQTIQTVAFTLVTNDFIRDDSSFSLEQLSSCTLNAGSCTGVNFYVDAFASRLTGIDHGWQAIGITDRSGESYFYFEIPAFTTPGVAPSEVFPREGWFSLSVSAIPEPASALLLLSGSVVLVAGVKRRSGVATA